MQVWLSAQKDPWPQDEHAERPALGAKKGSLHAEHDVAPALSLAVPALHGAQQSPFVQPAALLNDATPHWICSPAEGQ